MSSFLLITCILSAFAAKGYSLTCVECSSLNDQACEETSRVCPPGSYACVLTHGVTTLGGMKIANIYLRKCGERSWCNKTGSMSLPNGNIKTSSTCCDTNNCTPPQPVLPLDSFDKNGIQCKTCYAPNSKSCDTEEIMECTGNEMMCMTQISNTTGNVPSTTTASGCSTKEMCYPTHQVWTFGKNVFSIENICANSGVALYQHLLLAIIFACVSLTPMY